MRFIKKAFRIQSFWIAGIAVILLTAAIPTQCRGDELNPDSQEWEYRAAEAWIACYDTGLEYRCRKVCLNTRSSVRRHMVEALCLEKIVEDHFKQGGTWLEEEE